MAQRDPYEVLGIERGATDKEIKLAYRRLAMKYHPDRNPDDPEAGERFKEGKQAYETLSDPAKRATHDRDHADYSEVFRSTYFEDALSADFSDARIKDLFDDLLAKANDRRTWQREGRAPPRGESERAPRHPIEIDLEDAVNGTTVEVEVPGEGKCETCNGRGADAGSKRVQCYMCDGKGRAVWHRGARGKERCYRCRGTGTIESDPCRRCDETGRVRKLQAKKINIPPGAEDGDKLWVPGRPGGENTYFEVSIREHPLFKRQGQNLRYEVPIEIGTATLGGTVRVPCLDGEVELKIPRGTQTGTVLRVRGKGLGSRRWNRKGDLLCQVLVVTPTKLTRQQERLLEELQATFASETTRRTN